MYAEQQSPLRLLQFRETMFHGSPFNLGLLQAYLAIGRENLNHILTEHETISRTFASIPENFELGDHASPTQECVKRIGRLKRVELPPARQPDLLHHVVDVLPRWQQRTYEPSHGPLLPSEQRYKLVVL